MNTETQVPTGEETQNQTPESEVKPVPEQDATPDAEKSGDVKPDPQTIELKRLERELRKAQRNNARLYQELGAAREQTKAPQEEPKQQEPDVNARAEQIAETKLFAQTAERIVGEGKKANPDFIEKLKDLAAEVGEFVKPNGLPSDFMRAVLDVSDKPTELLYYLGKNPDIAEELSDLPVTKLAARLDRIERSLAEPQPKQSSAPKPLEPVKPRAKTSDLPSDDDSPDEWMKKEYARMKAKGLLSG